MLTYLYIYKLELSGNKYLDHNSNEYKTLEFRLDIAVNE